MSRTRLFRIVACVLALFLLQTGCLRERRTPVDTGACPAAALRWLTSPNRKERKLSRYDFLIRKYAGRIGMDWRLLAAIIFQESQFNEDAESNKSAKGLMQIRDVTAEHYGVDPEYLFDPDTNVFVGTRLLADLLRGFRAEGLDSVNVVRFTLASYNSGGGALAKRREEAAEAGLDPNEWEAVAEIYRRKSNITPAYITAIEETYEAYKEATTPVE